MNGDGRAGESVGPRDGPHHPLGPRCQPGFVDRAFQDPRLDPGPGDPLGDVLDEEVNQRVLAPGRWIGSLVMEPERDVVVGVEPGRDHDVNVDLVVDALYARDVAAYSDDCRVDDRVDPESFELAQFRDSVIDALFLVPTRGVVL